MSSPPVVTLSFAWTPVPANPWLSQSHYFEYYLDGVPLAGLAFVNPVAQQPPLGWSLEHDQQVLDRLTLAAPSDLAELGLTAPWARARQSLYVCALCGDLHCGTTTARIFRVGDQVQWDDFAGFSFDPGDPEDPYHLQRYRRVGPFRFSWDQYRRALDDAFRLLREQPLTN